MTFDNLIFRAYCFPWKHWTGGNCTWEEQGSKSGSDNATVECEYPCLQLYGLETTDLQSPVTLKVLEKGVDRFSGVIKDNWQKDIFFWVYLGMDINIGPIFSSQSRVEKLCTL